MSLDDFAYGVRRFVIGLAKKVLIANVVAGPADQIFGLAPGSMTPSAAWLGIICYTLQIYFDFSGYSDMALGLGRMFGFRFPENFRWPYVAETVQDFWRRWHISLSAWFRDYLYVPLGGNRTSAARTYCNLVIVFFLCGLVARRQLELRGLGPLSRQFSGLGTAGTGRGDRGTCGNRCRHAYLLVVVMIGWVFFRADSLPAAVEFLKALARPGSRHTHSHCPTVVSHTRAVAGARGWRHRIDANRARVGQVARWVERARRRARLRASPQCDRRHRLVLLLVASIMQIAARSYNPFIYFRF